VKLPCELDLTKPFLKFMPNKKDTIDLIMKMYTVEKNYVLDSPRKGRSRLTSFGEAGAK
jgi:hypothetical protein